MPRAPIDSRIAPAARMARPGRSNVARAPSPGGFDETPLEPGNLVSNDLVVSLEDRLPRTVTHRDGQVGRVRNVGEEHGGKDAIRHRPTGDAAQELFDAAQNLADVLGHEDPIGARQLDEPRVRDVLHQVAGLLRRDDPVSTPVEDQRRALDER